MDRALNSDPVITADTEGRFQRWRNWIGFWLLGLCNNFAYVVMLSAAHDILQKQESQNTTTPAVLLADILPTLIIKFTAPFYIHKVPYGFRVLVCFLTAVVSFLMVSFSSTILMSITGVVFASISSGLGELSFLSLSVFFSRDVLSGWGSGTGAAGVAGAFLYSAFTQAGLTPQVTLWIMLVVPVILAVSYFFLLVFPPSFPQWRRHKVGHGPSRTASSQERRPLIEEETDTDEDSEPTQEEQDNCTGHALFLMTEDKHSRPLTFTEQLYIIKGLLKFIFPLSVVYFAEYFINQGLLELLYFPDSSLSHAEQYRWYQTLYQIGVFFSRTSLVCFKIRKIFLLSLLQCVNAVLLVFAVYYQFLHYPWVVFIIVLYEGLLGGAAYVNTFYFISKETAEREREFAMAAASVGDSLGIALSAAASFPEGLSSAWVPREPLPESLEVDTRQPQDMSAAKGGLVIFTANSNPSSRELGRRIAERLGVELGKVQVYQEANRETRVQIEESVRSKDVFIIQTVSKDVNTTIMELLIMVYACRTSCARNIIGVIPYFPYSKQCKMRKRGSIVSKLLASMMCKAGLTHLITMDLHQKEIQGFFNIPVDNLRASPFLLQYIQEEIPDYRNAVIVAKSPASAKRAQSFAERLRLGIAVIHGEAQDAESDLVDGRHSPPTVKNIGAIHPSLEIPLLIPKEKPPITVVGDVGGRIAIIVDDIIDDVDSFLAAAETLKERGAYKIFVMATHGILSSDAPQLIEESAIDEVVVTNTIPHEIQKLQCPKIKTVDISMILSEAIRRIHNGESMSYLFRNIGMDD
ncbi:Phosphoribosyl pyrophosphate synthase-associated protein 2 [Anabarilius grahami]|uniref:Phosphoribosyl pyrophosphate synthase-associated protein 2 n=2 Tax=Xenocypridinae TaxID=2743747 RepID=A0A3N0YTY6_ANAGA|nr:Phosphoribosyl pyrophosphate synthase-associated protein 2 [Anabarilius grahami]